MEEIDKKIVKGIIKLKVMKILWSGPTTIEKISEELMETLGIGLDSETITRTLDVMEKNGYISKPNRIRLKKGYALTSEGKSFFEHTWQSLNYVNTLNLNSEKFAKWICARASISSL